VEYWNDGIMNNVDDIFPLFHYSNIPFFQKIISNSEKEESSIQKLWLLITTVSAWGFV